MDNEVIETSMAWRGGLLVLGVALLAGVAVNALAMLRGEWTWDGKGTAIAVALGLLTVLVLAGNALAWTTKAYVDPETQTLHFSALGRSESRPLTAPTTVRLERKDAAPTGLLRQWQFVVSSPERAPLSITTPFLGDHRELAEQLRPVLETNPGLPADDFTRQSLERPDQLTR